MQNIPAELIEVKTYDEPGYAPIIDFENWRVAVMNGGATPAIEDIEQLNKHVETDEVFVLLQGRCHLFLGSGDDRIEQIYIQELEPLTLYNVKQGVWHSHILSRDAKVLIVENRDTVAENSPGCMLTEEQRRQLVAGAASAERHE